MVATFLRDASDSVPWMPNNVVWVEMWRQDPGGTQVPVTDELRADVARILPTAEVIDVRRIESREMPVIVADPGVVRVLQLDDTDVRALDSGTVLVIGQPGTAYRASETVRVGAALLPTDWSNTPIKSRLLSGYLLVGPSSIGEATITQGAALFHLPTPTTAAQRTALEKLASTGWGGTDPFNGVAPAATYQLSYWTPGQWKPSPGLVELALVALPVAFVSGVVAVGLMLAAAETRDELQTMNAVGARPRSLAAVAGIKAALLAALGGALAIPVALVAIAIVVAAAKSRWIVIPWMTLAGLLFVVPLVSGVGAFAASRLGQRFRPIQITATD